MEFTTRHGLAAVVLPLAALALLIGVLSEGRDRYEPGTDLIDVVLIEQRTSGEDVAVLRISDPNTRKYCRVLRASSTATGRRCLPGGARRPVWTAAEMPYTERLFGLGSAESWSRQRGSRTGGR